jgi:hypothetical protein
MDDMDGVVNQALAAHTRKGRRGSPDRRGMSGRRASPDREASPELRQNKDLSKMICYEFHEFFPYASHCTHRKGRGRR